MKIHDVSLTESISMISDKDWQTVLTLVPPNAKRNLMLNEPRDRLVGTVCRLLSDIKAHVGGEYAENAKQIAELLMPYALKEIDRALTLSASQDWLSFSGANALAKAFSEYIPAIKAVVEKHRSIVVKHIVATANEDPGAVKAEIAFVNRLGLDWPELDSVVYPAFETHLLNLFDNNQAIKTLYKIVFVLDEIGITLNKLSRLEKVIDNFKEQLLWYNNTEISDMLWARIKAFMHNVKSFKQADLSWPELDNPAAYLKSHFEADKTNTVKKLLSELRSNTAAQFVLKDVDALRSVGITWPELDIVEHSMNKDINRPQLNEADKQFDQTVVDQLNAILPKPMRSRLESVNRFFFIAYFIDFLFDLQKAKFSESKKYQAFDLLKPIVYEYIEHYIKRLNDPRHAFSHFIEVIERLERLNKEYIEFDYTELFERNKPAIIKMLLGSVRNYMETPDNVGRWRTYESYINFAKLLTKLGLSWPEINKIVSSLASDRYVKTLDRPQSTLGSIADLVSGMKRDRMTLQQLMPNARAKIEGAKDRFINRNYFSFRWRDDIKFELDNTLLQYYRDLKSLGFEWPEIDQYLAASTTRERAELQKRQLVSSMLNGIKEGQADGVPHGIKTLRTMGIDWPELTVIEKSVNSLNNKQINEDDYYRRDERLAEVYQTLSELFAEHKVREALDYLIEEDLTITSSINIQKLFDRNIGVIADAIVKDHSIFHGDTERLREFSSDLDFLGMTLPNKKLSAELEKLRPQLVDAVKRLFRTYHMKYIFDVVQVIYEISLFGITIRLNEIFDVESEHDNIIVQLLQMMKTGLPEEVEATVDELRKAGCNWPELAVIERSINSDANKKINESQDLNAATEEEQLATVSQHGYKIRFIENPSDAVKLAAVKEDCFAIGFVKNPSEELQLIAVKRNPDAILYIKNPSDAAQLIAVKKQPYILRDIAQPSEAVKLAAVKQDPYVIDLIRKPSEEVYVATLLTLIKRSDIGWAAINITLDAVQRYPNSAALKTITKSLTAMGFKNLNEAAMSDESYRYHASNIAHHIRTGDPVIAMRYMGDRDITIDDLDPELRKELEASKADAIRWLLKLFQHDIFRFGRFIEPINRVKLDWPELAILNRSFDSEHQKREEEFRRHRQY